MNDTTQSTALSGEVLDQMPPAQPLTVTAPSANPYLALVETMVSRGGDLSNLDRMLDLQIKWEANEARKAFVAAMAAFKAEPITITKGKHVSYRNKAGTLTEYDHAELADVTQVIVPLMAKHGLSHRWTFRQDAGKGITVGCVITHRDGHSDEPVEMTAPPDDSGGKNSIQSIASTKTYLERYTLLAATGVATGGEIDTDGRDWGCNAGEDDGPGPLQVWFDAIEAAADVADLKKTKVEMIAAVGDDQGRVPKALLDAYNAKVKALS